MSVAKGSAGSVTVTESPPVNPLDVVVVYGASAGHERLRAMWPTLWDSCEGVRECILLANFL